MTGPSFIHLELTSRCNKSCWMCGRRKMEREHPELCDWGDMDYGMVREIAGQMGSGAVVQFHNNGEPLLYPYLLPALLSFKHSIRCLNTNGKLLVERAPEIIGNLETMAISVIQDDPEGEEQVGFIRDFDRHKGERSPRIILRYLGSVDEGRKERLKGFGLEATRILHIPDFSRSYSKKVTIPEIDICLDLLTHLAIDRYGNISICVRFDPKGELRIGHVETGIQTAWASPKRKKYLEYHIAGRRNELPGCRGCEYFGIPRGE
jgi:radical SAM protein with 4Fe4S-binding SPASM domain